MEHIVRAPAIEVNNDAENREDRQGIVDNGAAGNDDQRGILQEEVKQVEDAEQRMEEPLYMQGKDRLKFKDLDGVYKVADLPLLGILKLPTGSCEAMLLRVARNAGFGYVPINEYVRDRQTILDKTGNNGLFLNSHDPSMEALAYKTTVSVPEIPANNMF